MIRLASFFCPVGEGYAVTPFQPPGVHFPEASCFFPCTDEFEFLSARAFAPRNGSPVFSCLSATRRYLHALVDAYEGRLPEIRHWVSGVHGSCVLYSWGIHTASAREQMRLIGGYANAAVAIAHTLVTHGIAEVQYTPDTATRLHGGLLLEFGLRLDHTGTVHAITERERCRLERSRWNSRVR